MLMQSLANASGTLPVVSSMGRALFRSFLDILYLDLDLDLEFDLDLDLDLDLGSVLVLS